MKYYVETIEQINSEGGLTEYAKVEKCNTEQAALTKFYQFLSIVANDLGKGHTYLDAKIVNSLGGCIKKDSVGAYQTEETPAENTEATE